MKRHPALVALSHDHHHALVEARRLRHKAASDEDPAAAASAFHRFYAGVTVPHFREEEERLFPLVVDAEEAQPLIVQALLDHQRLHALAAALDDQADPRTSMRELGQRLEAHVRLEERELFPLIERLAPVELDGLDGAGVPRDGPVWGAASEDLNATLLAWNVGGGPPEHENDERDVLIFVAEGSATVTVDREERQLAAGEGLIVGKGRRRKITAGAGGVRYLSVHLRRPPLEILQANRRSEA
jgi:mannose-6-phosphate isomerase-like protein (cupin superfamily)